ncbi:MAG: tetratricopeptide repeat protein [Candidatus Obscuribacterales bacterium]|nr:MAG: hypothetical protein EKK48_25265 [Candidatus Melainabacteria bacterium]
MAKMKNQMKQQQKRTKRVGPESSAMPVNTAESNSRGDQLSTALLFGLLVVSVVVLSGGLYWGITNFHSAFSAKPIDWLQCVVSAIVIVASFLVARSIAWMSMFGSIALASRMGAWKMVETIGSKGPWLRKVLPGGSPWLTTALVQSQVNRGQYEAALAASQSEWDFYVNDEKQKTNLGTIAFTAGLAQQGLGNIKESQMWNERAIEILNKSLDQLSKPQKGLVARFAAPQSEQALGQLRMQLAAAYFNNATVYFNANDYRRAKENYKQAIENAKKSPDFPQRNEMVKFGQEQLARLKHS